MDYTIQKAVELGVRTIIPLLSDHSNVRLDSSRAEKRLAHWTGIIINACEQCGRNVLPEIRQPAILSEWLATDPDRDRLVLHPGASLSLTSFTPRGRELALICGTEGGLSEKELEICVRSGCHMVSMGPRTLRTETASIAAVAICQSYWGDIN
jgi:16S rRNA (uracil1498-N3)-methyltransferase